MDYQYPKKDHQIHFYYVNLKSDTRQERVSTWDTFHLIPASRPIINPPQVKTTYIEVPGFNGKLDFSDVNAGRAYMGPRTGSLEFAWSGEMPKPWNYGNTPRKNLELYLRHIFNGKLFNMVLEDDPYYFYRGRIQFGSIDVDGKGAGTKVTLDYNLHPINYNTKHMSNPLTPLDVGEPSIASTAYYSKYLNDETVTIPIKIHVVPATLYIYTTGTNVYYNFESNGIVAFDSYQLLNVGVNRIKKLMPVGRVSLTIRGTGNVIVNYIEGRL